MVSLRCRITCYAAGWWWRLAWLVLTGIITLGPTARLSTQVYAAPPAETPHAELRQLFGPNAEILVTEHFVVAYDAPLATVRGLTARLEATYRGVEKFCTFNEIVFKPPEAPLEILFFNAPDDFYRYAHALGVDAHGLNGIYHSGNNRSAFFNILNHPSLSDLRRAIERHEAQVAELSNRRLSKAERDKKHGVLEKLHFYRNQRNRIVEKLNRSVVQHEAAHHLLFDAGVHVKGAKTPDWLVEGLAVLFETPPSAKGAGIGTINQMRLADFRAACGEEPGHQHEPPRKMKPEDMRHAYDTGRFIPLRRFIALDKLAAGPNDPNTGYYYAQAWGLTVYLQRTQRKSLARYINALSRRVPGMHITPEEEIAQFESVFGPLDETFERRWACFVFNLRVVPEGS